MSNDAELSNRLTRSVPDPSKPPPSVRLSQEAAEHIEAAIRADQEKARRRALGLDPPLPIIEVWSTVELYGFHHWPDAAKVNPNRAYLGDRHRHRFVITATVRVVHEDRQVEFHDLHDAIYWWWQPERGPQSCEQIGVELHRHLTGKGMDVSQIVVSEDGYDGATLTWPL